MQGKLLVLAPLLLLLTACRHEQLLPVAHAAGSDEFRASIDTKSEEARPEMEQAPETQPTAPPVSPQKVKQVRRPGLHDSCYAYILMRPQAQRAAAVQARLNKADAIEAAFSSQTVDVDLEGDHANVLALQFPVVWPSNAYQKQVSSVIEEYLSTPEILDYMCNAGFAQVKLSARGANDGRLHVLWTAKVTTEGLMKGMKSPEPGPTTETVSYLKPE
jgi:hypothetical protein